MSTDPDEILLDADDKMDGAVQALRRELNGVRTGRAHPSLIETLPVDYYGAMTPLKQLGSINAPEARLLTIQVWDRGAIRAIEKAIQSSDLGLNPAIDGQIIRLPIPTLTGSAAENS
jgi:ribosome recycling factor